MNKLEKAHRLLLDLTNPYRKLIMNILIEHGELTNTEIWIKTRIGWECTVSDHLSILRDAGIVKTRRYGKNSINSINMDVLIKVAEAINNFADPSVEVCAT